MGTSKLAMPIQEETLKAAGTIARNRFVIGPVAGAAQAGAAGFGIGVSGTSAVTGEFFPATTSGIALVEAGATISDNDLIQSDADGKAITRVSTNPILGRARSAATAIGQLIPVDLFKA